MALNPAWLSQSASSLSIHICLNKPIQARETLLVQSTLTANKQRETVEFGTWYQTAFWIVLMIGWVGHQGAYNKLAFRNTQQMKMIG